MDFNHENLILKALTRVHRIDKITNGILGIKTSKLYDFKHTPDSGTLIVFEGCDGSGKTYSADKLAKYLVKEGYEVERTKWNSSDIFTKAIDKAKEEKVLTPLLYSLVHMVDLVYRYENFIIPALDKNKIVICDRYIYTSMVRDSVRGVDMEIPKNVYKFFREPDLIFHCTAPADVLFSRLTKEKGISYYGCGLDMELSSSKDKNCKLYQKLTGEVYDKILPDMCKNYCKLDTNKDPEEVFNDMKNKVDGILEK